MARTARSARRRLAATRRAAGQPLAPGRALGEAAIAGWARYRTNWTRWRTAFLLVSCAVAAAIPAAGVPAALALAAWVATGCVAWWVTIIFEAELEGRRRAHARAEGPAVRGWRLIPSSLERPEVVLMLDLAIYLHEAARVVERPVGGHRGRRLTFEVGLRDLSRQWARARLLPVRRGARLARALVEAGVIREVRISQATAWRLAQPSAADAIRALERWAGRRLIDWSIGWCPAGS